MQSTTPEERAAKRVGQYTGFLWHWVAFVTGNVALWAIDWVTGDGFEWAY